MALAVRNSGTRQDTWLIMLTLNGNSMGIWDKKSGGEIDSDDTKYYPGGMQPPQSLGGRVTPGNVTLQRIFDRKDDGSKINTLIKAVGKGRVTISQRSLDQDGNPYGNPLIYHGKLKRVTPPETDSESSTAAIYEIEVSIANPPAAV